MTKNATTSAKGTEFYARVLVEAWDEAVTPAEVSARLDRKHRTVHQIMWRLEQLGVLRVAEWRRPQSNCGQLVPAFQIRTTDDQPSAQHPRAELIQRPGAGLARSCQRPELVAFAHLVKALRLGATRQELRDASGLTRYTIAHAVRTLRALGVAYRSGWETSDNGCMRAEVLMLGRRRDCPRPPCMTNKDRKTRHRIGLRTREAARRVTAALAGSGHIPVTGVQSYGLLAGSNR